MNSLFGKILLWFWAALVINTVGSALITGLSGPRPYLLSRLIAFQLEEARTAYETGGRPGLEQFMQRFHSVFGGEGILTDGSGRDVLTGADESGLLGRSREGVALSGLPTARRGDRAQLGGRQVLVHFRDPARAARLLVPGATALVDDGGRRFPLLPAGVLSDLSGPEAAARRGTLRPRRSFRARRNSPARRTGRAGRTFDRMADRIQTLVDAERRLLLDISHELRSPLARLRVAVELARSGQNRDAHLDRIDKEAERLNSLVGGLLQVTRAEGDPDSLRREPVRLDRLLEELVADSSLEAQSLGSQVRLINAQPATVQGDPELLRRAIENVIRNAIRHAPEGTEVEASLEAADGRPVLRIRDYGPGVPEEALPRIFDAFYRVETDRDRASGGAGLGLSIARRAVELHKGTIRARNTEPGLLVEIDLPAAPGAD
jgi:signal transduction histidine kinase